MEGNSLKIIENLCNIFETRIKLDKEKNIKTPYEVLDNYEKYAKKIDAMHNEKFEKEIRKLITPESTLEKEEARLNKLIELLNKRITERNDLENRFYLATGSYINELQLIVSEEELDDKKMRLEAITKYLDTTNEINTINDSIAKLKESLSEETIKEEDYQKKNKIIEDELYSEFKDIIDKDEYFNTINEDNINEEIDNILDKVNENKETLDITKDSVNSLVSIGNNDDYSSYIEDAERNYYLWKNRELLLKIYEFVIDIKEEFIDIYEKRTELSKIIRIRKGIISSLSFEVKDELSLFEKLVDSHLDILKDEKEVLDNITNYNNRINFKEERLNELNEINSSDEILSILREYNLIDTYSNIEIQEDIPKEIVEVEENLINEFYDPYRIVEVKDYPKTLNIGLAKLKGESVREKVNKKLNSSEEDVVSSGTEIPIEIKEAIPEMKPIEMVEEVPSRTEKNIPTWGLPEVSNSETSEVKIQTDSEPIVWKEPVIEEKTSEPLWQETNTFNIEPKMPNMEPVVKKELDNNSFWIPVSDSGVGNNDFPSLNIPVSSNNDSNLSNFGFPEINN